MKPGRLSRTLREQWFLVSSLNGGRTRTFTALNTARLLALARGGIGGGGGGGGLEDTATTATDSTDTHRYYVMLTL